MTATKGVLALIGDSALRDDVERVAAAAGVPVVHASEPSSRTVWSGAVAVLLDVHSAAQCAQRALPRRGHVMLVARAEPQPSEWQAAIAVGAHRVLTLPRQDGDLVAAISEAAESSREERLRGAVVAVIGARGGAGASLFATALAYAAPQPLLIDSDPWGGGLDLVLGSEAEPGLRWPDLAIQGGRLNYPALRDALPRRHGISVLSTGRPSFKIDAEALTAVIEAGCRGGASVICDIPRRCTPAVEVTLEGADLVVLLAPADVRSCAAASAMAPWLSAMNPNVGLVVRGPAPGGLRSVEVSRTVGLPLLAAMRPQPGVPEVLERGGLRVGQRSPLGVAARRVVAVLQQHPTAEAA